MEAIDNQPISDGANRTGAVISRMDADENRMDAAVGRTNAATINNIAIINAQSIYIEGPSPYTRDHGQYVLVFQEALKAVATNTEVLPGTLRVLLYVLAIVESDNCFAVEVRDIAANTGYSIDTVERALKQLIQMCIICKKAGTRERSIYELSNKMLNPRMGLRKDTRKIRMDDLPELRAPDAVTPLIAAPIIDF